MLFNSFEFLIFFPVVTLIYFILPAKVKWVWLLITSYFFYMNWHAEYALLMLACTAVTFVCSLLIDSAKEQKKRKAFMWTGIVLNIGLLAYFKYTGFMLELVQRACDMLGLAVTTPKVSILLPVMSARISGVIWWASAVFTRMPLGFTSKGTTCFNRLPNWPTRIFCSMERMR